MDTVGFSDQLLDRFGQGAVNKADTSLLFAWESCRTHRTDTGGTSVDWCREDCQDHPSRDCWTWKSSVLLEHLREEGYFFAVVPTPNTIPTPQRCLLQSWWLTLSARKHEGCSCMGGASESCLTWHFLHRTEPSKKGLGVRPQKIDPKCNKVENNPWQSCALPCAGGDNGIVTNTGAWRTWLVRLVHRCAIRLRMEIDEYPDGCYSHIDFCLITLFIGPDEDAVE